MERRKKHWIIDFFTILVMMATVILLSHPIGRNWTEEERERYVGTDGEYSPDVDTYYYLRKAKEFSRGGVGSITLVAHREEDSMCTTGDAIAKEANGAMPMLLPASAALTWYGLRAIGIDVSIYTVTIRFCAFLLSLFVIPVYLFLRRRTSWIAAVLGAFLVALKAPFFRHSHVGFFDTDAMIGFLALILVLSLFECVVQKKRGQQIIYGTVSLSALILLRFTWTAFFIYGVIAVGTVLVGLIVACLCGGFQKKQKDVCLVPAVFLVVIVVASIALGWDSFLSLAKGFLSTPSGAGDWPSETLNIMELQKISFYDANSIWYLFLGVGRDLSSVTGGILALVLLVISTMICIFQLVQLFRHRSENFGEAFLLAALLTWLLGTTVLAFFGMRYLEFVTLPSAIVCGLGFNKIGEYCKASTVEGKRIIFLLIGIMVFGGLVLRFRIIAVIVSATIVVLGWFLSKRRNSSVLLVALAFVILIPVGISCEVVCATETPYFERPVEDAMIWVRENTTSDAVLADFWNLAYTYQYYGERRTLADGGTYNGRFFYWLANMLVTEDSHLSIGIARMLQSCGIDGSDYAEELTGSAEKTRLLLKEILPLPRSDAEVRLRSGYPFSEEQISRLLDYTHPLQSPGVYYVASHNTFDLVSMLMIYKKWGKDNERTVGETYYSETAVTRPNVDETVFCKIVLGDEPSINGRVAIELSGDGLNGWIVKPDGEKISCERQIYIKDGMVMYDRVVELPEGPGDNEALMLFEENGMVSVVLLEKEAVDSTFIKLFLMNGSGQDVFEKVYDSEDGKGVQDKMSDNSSISIWKVKTEYLNQ